MAISIETISDKISKFQRISPDEALFLYEKVELPELGVLANQVRERINGKRVYFNRNIHVEPTNICIYQCKFCAYSRKQGEDGN